MAAKKKSTRKSDKKTNKKGYKEYTDENNITYYQVQYSFYVKLEDGTKKRKQSWTDWFPKNEESKMLEQKKEYSQLRTDNNGLTPKECLALENGNKVNIDIKPTNTIPTLRTITQEYLDYTFKENTGASHTSVESTARLYILDKKFCPFLDKTIITITKAEMIEWKNKIKHLPNKAPSTIIKIIECMISIWNYAISRYDDQYPLLKNHATFIGKEKTKIMNQKKPEREYEHGPKQKYWNKKEYLLALEGIENNEDLSNAMKAKNKALISFLFNTGCRKSEVKALTWKKIDFKTGKVLIDAGIVHKMNKRVKETLPKGQNYIEKDPKNHKTRIVILLDDSYKYLKEYYDIVSKKDGFKKSLYVFGTFDGPIADTSLRRTVQRWYDWMPIEKRGETKRIDVHGFRHSAISHWRNDLNIPDSLAYELTGHSDETLIRDVYGHMNLIDQLDKIGVNIKK